MIWLDQCDSSPVHPSPILFYVMLKFLKFTALLCNFAANFRCMLTRSAVSDWDNGTKRLSNSCSQSSTALATNLFKTIFMTGSSLTA